MLKSHYGSMPHFPETWLIDTDTSASCGAVDIAKAVETALARAHARATARVWDPNDGKSTAQGCGCRRV